MSQMKKSVIAVRIERAVEFSSLYPDEWREIMCHYKKTAYQWPNSYLFFSWNWDTSPSYEKMKQYLADYDHAIIEIEDDGDLVRRDIRAEEDPAFEEMLDVSPRIYIWGNPNDILA